MTLEIAATYGFVATVTIALRWMAARNRQSGWQRERNDLFLENLMTWASTQGVLHGKPEQPAKSLVRPAASPANLTGQLLSLQNALNTNAGMRYQPKVVEQISTASRDLSVSR